MNCPSCQAEIETVVAEVTVPVYYHVLNGPYVMLDAQAAYGDCALSVAEKHNPRMHCRKCGNTFPIELTTVEVKGDEYYQITRVIDPRKINRRGHGLA